MSLVGVIDCKISNVDSVCRALKKCGADVVMISEPSELDAVSHIILPGQGSFRQAMSHLFAKDLISPLMAHVVEDKKPLLGICVGMQILASIGYEGGAVNGLGLINGSVKKLKPLSEGERIPHIGWNEVHYAKPSRLLRGVSNDADFYFVHSYVLRLDGQDVGVATTGYCGGFWSVVEKGNVFGVQFHPEKSQAMGLKVLHNFLSFS